MPDEHAAGTVDAVGFDPGGDEADDLLLEDLPITFPILVPDDEVDRQTLERQ